MLDRMTTLYSQLRRQSTNVAPHFHRLRTLAPSGLELKQRLRPPDNCTISSCCDKSHVLAENSVSCRVATASRHHVRVLCGPQIHSAWILSVFAQRSTQAAFRKRSANLRLGRCVEIKGVALLRSQGLLEDHGTAVFAVPEFRSLQSRLVGSISTLQQDLASDPIGKRLGTPRRGIRTLGIFYISCRCLHTPPGWPTMDLPN